MFSAFFTQAAVSPGRRRVFGGLVVSHLAVLLGCVWFLGHVPKGGPLVTGCVLLSAGIVEGAMLIGWRLTQLPKSQALEFLLVSPLHPGGVLLAEAAVGLTRLAYVTLSGLPILLLLVDCGYLEFIDLGLLLVMPFTWGAITGLALTAWAYEAARVRRWAERIMLGLTTIYLVVGLLAGEHLADWLKGLPANLGEMIIGSVQAFHIYNPFAVVAYWMSGDPFPAWDRALAVEAVAVGVVMVLLARTAWRMRGHFHERHYLPAEDRKRDKWRAPGDHPLSWWAVRRVTQYSGRVNLWFAGGFGVIYAVYTIAGPRWPAWLGRNVFQIFDQTGGVPLWATALTVLAAVPAAFQYGLWDSNAQDRCRRLELLLLTSLRGLDYWQAAALAAWRRGRGYLAIATLLWTAAAVAGGIGVLQALAGLAAGVVLWGLYFALGFWAFSRGIQANKLGLLLTIGLPVLAFGFVKLGWPALSGLVPPGSVYHAAADVTPFSTWVAGVTLSGTLMLLMARWTMRHCETQLRNWYSEHHGSMVLD
ncbi:MAG TPA: hypothetical protein VGY58_07800 [Gemmataceae bacterium]|nr:hypothetical protein [Gemmataceae bacterium]